MKKVFAGLVLAALSSAAASNQEVGQPSTSGVRVHGGFMRVDDYRALPDSSRTLYVIGVVDGLLQAPVVALQDVPASNRLGDCIQAMNVSDKQLTATVDGFLEAKLNEVLPDRNDMKYAVFHVFNKACHDHGMRVW